MERNRRRFVLVLTVVAAACVVVPALVSAQCGGTYYANAHKDVGRGRPPLAIGDSVMLLAVERLAEIGYRVNARGCLGFGEAQQVIEQQESEDKLGHLVVVAVGANYGISMSEIRETLKALGGKRGEKRVLGLVTPRELGGGTSNDADVVRAAGRRYPNRVKVLDWVAVSAGNPGWFQPDGLHLTDSGAQAYANLFKKGLRYAGWPRQN